MTKNRYSCSMPPLLLPLLLHGAASSTNLPDALDALEFLNEGTTFASDEFFWAQIEPVGEAQKLVYLEAENVSCASYAGDDACVWSDGGQYYEPHPYRFKVGSGPRPLPPTWTELPGLDWNDPAAIVKSGTDNVEASLIACQGGCAATPGCVVGLWLNGTTRHGECWLASRKASTPRANFCGASARKGCEAFELSSPRPRYEGGVPPASGIRSAAPLGGVGAGSFELRGDGTMREWTPVLRYSQSDVLKRFIRSKRADTFSTQGAQRWTERRRENSSLP